MLKLSTPAWMLLALLTACGGESAEDQLRSAKASFETRDYKDAQIHLKNVLQKEPSSPEARLLLGQTLLRQDDPISALAELEKALQLGVSNDLVVPEIARAMLMRGQAAQLVSRFSTQELSSPAARGELASTLAAAQLEIGKTSEAQAQIDKALQNMPGLESARIVQARLLATKHDLPGARAQVNSVVESNPKNADAWLLKGQLEMASADSAAPDRALVSLTKAVELTPRSMAAQSAALWAQLGRRDLAAANERLKAMQAIRANHPTTLFFSAVLALEANDLGLAREKIQALLKMTPDDPRGLHIAGAVEYRRGAQLQAQTLLNKALSIAPDMAPTRLLLAQSYLRSGEPARTLNLVQPLLQSTQPSSEAYAYAADALMLQGKLDQAEAFYRRAADLNPKDPRNHTALAMAQISKGQMEAGFAALRSIADNDGSSVADQALIAAHLNKGQYDAALRAIDSFAAKSPKSATPDYLRGIAHRGAGNLKAARTAMESALKVDPAYYPAAAALVSLDVEAKDLKAALSRIEQFLAGGNRQHLQAQMAAISLRAELGASQKELEDSLNGLVRSNPQDTPPRIALVELHIKNNDLRSALSAAQNALAALPDNPEILMILGRVQGLNGDINQAMGSYGRLATLQPSSPLPYLLMADLHMRQKEVAAARSQLRKALSLQADFLPAQRGLAMLEVISGNTREAKALAKSMQAQPSTSAQGAIVEGDIEFGQANYKAAARAFQTGLEKAPSTELAIKLHQALSGGGMKEERQRLETQWLASNPRDLLFLLYLGDQALAEKNYAQAEKSYRAVLSIVPDRAEAINNLAWALMEQKKPGAVELAQRAVKLAPKNADLWDTLARALATEGRNDKALEAAKTALELAPNSAPLRLSYAKYLISTGHQALAKAELKTLASLPEKSVGKDEAKALLEKMSQ